MEDRVYRQHEVGRREVLVAAVGGMVALAAGGLSKAARAAGAPHVLPELPYEGNALEPIISARTLEFHHASTTRPTWTT